MEKDEYRVMHDIEQSYWWFVGKQFLVKTFLKMLSIKNIEFNRILDIGCGTGIILKLSKYFGVAYGMELSSEAIRFLRQRDLNLIAQADANKCLPFKNNAFALITCLDVLEHVPKKEVVSFLRAVIEALQPGGNAVINVPQVSGFTSLFCRYNDFTHETLFTEMSLRQVLSLAGFSDMRFIREKWPLKYTPRHLAYRLVRLLWYIILKLIYTIESPGERHPGSFQSRLVASASRPLQNPC